MRAGVFLQARIHSTRLSNKVIEPIAGDAVLTWCMRALSKIDADVHAVLTDVKSADVLVDIIQAGGFLACAGNTDHVLSRFARFARVFSLDWVIRATADNPCVSAYYAEKLLTTVRNMDVDYARYTNLPLGTGVECVRGHALHEACERAVSQYDREHVCPYIYNHPEQYNLLIQPAELSPVIDPKKMQFSVSLDTQNDLENLQFLFSKRRKSKRGQSIELEELIQLQ